MSINYTQLLDAEFGQVDKKPSTTRSKNTDKLYKKFNPQQGIGKSTKGLTHIPDDIKNMSVWDD
jgi:hypothetical protein